MIIEGTHAYDDNMRHLADIRYTEDKAKVTRLPACSIGEYFEILTELNDMGFTAV